MALLGHCGALYSGLDLDKLISLLVKTTSSISVRICDEFDIRRLQRLDRLVLSNLAAGNTAAPPWASIPPPSPAALLSKNGIRRALTG